MTKTTLKTLNEYEEIALEKYGVTSHAVKWIRAQQSNKGVISMSDESMMKLLERMHAKTSGKTEAAELPPPVPEVTPRDQEPVKSMFANLKKK